MGQARQPLARNAPPAGARWKEFRGALFREWGRPACFACGCPVDGPGAGEVEHRISWHVRPDLTWSRFWNGEPFLVPVHGSGHKRCPVHDIACNLVIGSNIARRDSLGRSVPLTPEEITAAQQRTQGRPRSSTGRDRRQPARKTPEVPAAPARPRAFPKAGREW